MAQHTIKTLAPATWAELTDADVSAITFQNVGDDDVYIVVQTTDTMPTGTPVANNAYRYGPKTGEINVTLANMALGLTSPDRVFAYAPNGGAVLVSHA